MSTVEVSNSRPSVTPVTVEGQPGLTLALPDGSHATVLLHGAHVLSWHAAGWGEQLYLSPAAGLGALQSGQAIRGGVPVIFPQFELKGPDTSLPRHGLARQRAWTPCCACCRPVGPTCNARPATRDAVSRPGWTRSKGGYSRHEHR